MGVGRGGRGGHHGLEAGGVEEIRGQVVTKEVLVRREIVEQI